MEPYNYLIMDYIPTSLPQYIKQAEMNFVFKDALEYIIPQMIKVLSNIHKHGYLHKDVKPDNFRIKNN